MNIKRHLCALAKTVGLITLLLGLATGAAFTIRWLHTYDPPWAKILLAVVLGAMFVYGLAGMYYAMYLSCGDDDDEK